MALESPPVGWRIVLRSLAGGTLFGEAWGGSPAGVLALHGWARTHSDFAAVLGPSTSHGAVPAHDAFDALAPDLPGFGATPPPPAPWGSADYAAALEPLFDRSLQSPVVVLGHSFGGRVAVALAAARPDQVRALVLTGVPLVALARRRRSPAAYRSIRALRRAGLLSEERLEKARQRYGSVDYRNAQGVMRAVLLRVLSETYDQPLSMLRCPVEFVWADDDSEAPLAVAEKALDLVPGSVLTRCGPVGHLTPLTAPQALRAALDRALPASAG